MARQPASPTPLPLPLRSAPAKWEIKTIFALPEDLPAKIIDAVNDGWKLEFIVPCRNPNDHVAYLTRTH